MKVVQNSPMYQVAPQAREQTVYSHHDLTLILCFNMILLYIHKTTLGCVQAYHI